MFAQFEIDQLKQKFAAQNEFLVVENLLGPETLQPLLARLPQLRPSVHRNYLPKHKKGGSVSRFVLDRMAPAFESLYTLPEFTQGLSYITGRSLLPCPGDDPHTYALYCYTEPGDHIGWHYDTSYYRGLRYTVLLGLVDRSSSRLEYQLYRDDPGRETESLSLALAPGMLVVFNGDKLYHRVTPLRQGEERIVLTMEYVTDARMSATRRFISNMKDAIAYFGFRDAFQGHR
ncbi:MAG: 2OG-Fe(II) oxygenase [Chromatiales bacterium]